MVKITPLLLAAFASVFLTGFALGLATERIRFDSRRQAALHHLERELHAWQQQKIILEKAR